jgi:hypothetical protein
MAKLAQEKPGQTLHAVVLLHVAISRIAIACNVRLTAESSGGICCR